MTQDNNLSPRHYGAEVLVKVAGSRKCGVLRWRDGRNGADLLFVSGRPQRFIDENNQEIEDRDIVVSALRTVALACTGTYSFENKDLSLVADRESLRIDTLGEVLVAVVREMKTMHLDSLWDARIRLVVQPTPVFERLAKAISKVSGEHVERPQHKLPVGSLISGVSIELQRTWAALLMMGGFEVLEDLSSRHKKVVSGPAIPEMPPSNDTVDMEFEESEVTIETPVDAYLEYLPQELRDLVTEIQKVHPTLETSNHYEVLGLAANAAAADIGKAYLANARKFHSDRFGGHDLGPAKRLAEEIFMRMEEAYGVLNNAKERESYDFILDRQAKGLPTDPAVILEAEELFTRAQKMVRLGNAVAASPLLEKVVEMNAGEPEFWAYYGWAVFNAQPDREGRHKAWKALERARKDQPELAVVYEFLGRLARVEGDTSAAARNLKKCLNLDPDNPEAERELRLLKMRKSDDSQDDGSIMSKLKSIFKK